MMPKFKILMHYITNIHEANPYLGSISVTETSFTDKGIDLVVDWSELMKLDPALLFVKKAGCSGTGRVAE